MRIKLTEDVKTEFVNKGKTGYTVAHVAYEGSKFPFKLMSFSNPATFEVLKNAKAGEEYEIDSVKEGQYFQWKSAKKAEGNATVPSDKSTYSAPSRNTYETPEERALRQRLIVRQSSLKEARETLAVNTEGKLQVEEIFELAERYASWVYEPADILDEDNDIPF